MKKLFLIAGLVIALTFGGVFTNTVMAGVSIEEVMCPCGACSNKAVNCGCGSAIQALEDAGFTSEDVKEYLENNQSV